MAKGGDFFQREKKKPQKSKVKTLLNVVGGNAPTFTMPEVISRKKRE